MIAIKKKKEPKELIEYRRSKSAVYDDMSTALKDKIKESLMCEQGHLCASSMRRIPQKNVMPDVTIEHWDAQHATDTDKGLDYRNMLAVCSGNRGQGELCCDAKRGSLPTNKQALKVNPLKPETLIGIKYQSNGIIYSDDPEINNDLNEKLNLNSERIGLPECRHSALKALINKVKSEHPTGDISLYCQRLLQRYTSDAEAKPPYVGILIAWLEHHINRSS